MSLLMDALRKAEADKKQASAADPDADIEATGEGEVAEDAATRELQSPGEGESAGALGSPRPSPETPAADAEGLELSLEPLEFDQRTDDPGTSQPDRLDETIVAESDTTSTMPSARGVETQLESYFDDSQAIAAPPSAIDSGAPGGDSGITETVTTAQTVFDAGPGGTSKRAIVWGAVVVVVIGSVLAAAGFYYFQQAPTALEIPSPSVAAGVERLPPKELPIVALDPVQDTPPTTLVTIESAVETEPVEAPGAVQENDAAEAFATATSRMPIDFTGR